MDWCWLVNEHMEIGSLRQNKTRILPNNCLVIIIEWLHHLNANKGLGEPSRWKSYKFADWCSEQHPASSTLQNSSYTTIYLHLEKHLGKTNKTRKSVRTNTYQPFSRVLVHTDISLFVEHQKRTFIRLDSRCHLDDLLSAIAHRVERRERERERKKRQRDRVREREIQMNAHSRNPWLYIYI